MIAALSARLASPSIAWRELARDELTLSPARSARILRMTALAMLVVIVSMALRVPEAAISCYMVFFVAKDDVVTTARTGVFLVVVLTGALALVFFFYTLTLNEPGLRLPLMALLIFAGMYFLHASPAGVIGLIFGFIISYALTFADQEPSPEALVHQVLWMWVVVAYPIALVVVADAVLGRRPQQVYGEGVAERLEAVAALLDPAGDRAASRARLERQLRLGAADLRPYVANGPPAKTPVRAALLRQTELLVLLANELPAELLRQPTAQPALERARDACRSAGAALVGRGTDGTGQQFELLAAERRRLDTLSPSTLALVLPLVGCLQTVVLGVHELARPLVPAAAPAKPSTAPLSSQRQTEAAQFGLKVTLAAMSAYLLYSGLEWYSLHTAMITCFFVAEDSLGATVHKLTLRLTGALVGAALGIGAIIVVLPRIESSGGLALTVGAVTLVAAWVATGSERIAYAGWQAALAFYLTVLQGFTRTSHMYVGRDRVFGILLGNVLMSLVFVSLWPVRVGPALRQALGRAVEALATLLRLPGGERGQVEQAEATVYEQLGASRQYASLARFERHDDRPAWTLERVPSLLILVHAIASNPVTTAPPAARAALATLHESAAAWLSALAAAIAKSAPPPRFTAPADALTTLNRCVDEAPATPDASLLKLQREWFALLRLQIEQTSAAT